MVNEKFIQLGILLGEIVLLILYVVGFYYLIHYIEPQLVSNIGSLPLLVVDYVVCFIVSFTFYPSIAQQRMVKGEHIARRVLSTCFLMLLLVSFTMLLIRPYNTFPRKFYLASIALFALVLFVERITTRRYLKHIRTNNRNRKEVVLIGNDPSVYKLYEILSTPIYGYHIVGAFYDGECTHEGMRNIRIGGSGDIYGWLTSHAHVHEIYGYFPREQRDLINMISKFCDNHLIRFYYLPAIDVFKGNMSFSLVEDVPLVARREEPLRNPVNRIIKRAFDIIFSTFVLVVLFPWIYIFVAIMIKIKSPGPVFFKQERTGLDGKVFKCIKFRSMQVNDQADTLQATKDDPRKFPFGDFLRKTNIDELPQFINVFMGDMSIVGPRPHMLKHTEEYSRLINRFMLRHLAKPGITGLAQVSGFRGETRHIEDMEGRVKKDIEYIENWTFFLDIKIIFKTVINMCGKEKGNAY